MGTASVSGLSTAPAATEERRTKATQIIDDIRQVDVSYKQVNTLFEMSRQTLPDVMGLPQQNAIP